MGPGGSEWGWGAGEGGPNFWPDREAGGRTQAPWGCCCGCHGCCCWWLGGREGCANPECPQKSGEPEAPRSPRGGGGVVGEGGGVPQPPRRAPLRSPRPRGLPGRPGPSARQGAVGGAGGGDRAVEEVRAGRAAGTGEEWQREPPGTVSDCCVPRAPGGLGERRRPAREFGNGQRRGCLGSALRPGDRCCCCYCCWWWCRGGRGAGKGRKARRRWLLLVKRWSPSATSELCSL